MYTIISKSKNIIGSLAILVVLSVSVVSCGKDKETAPSEEGGTSLIFTVEGIEEGNVPIARLSASTNEKIHNETSTAMIGQEKLASTQTFDALVSVEAASPNQLDAKKASTATKATKTLMSIGNQYRLLVYNETGTTLLKEVVATSGTNPNIKVDGGKKYKWIAVSINATTVPAITNGKIVASALANKDVLYASGTVSASFGDNYLNIVFQRKTTRMDVDVDSRGLFGEISSFKSLDIGTGTGTGFKSLIKSADLTIATGSWSGSYPVAATATVGNIVNKSTATGNFVKTLSVYTVIPTGTTVVANTMTMRPIFDVKMDPPVYYPATNSHSPTRTYGNSSTYLLLNNTSFTPIGGEQYRIGSRMIESGIKVAGIAWGRADLYYDARSGALDRYKFRPDAAAIHWFYGTSTIDSDQNSYWNWMSLTPTGTPGSGDPCALVYPAGLWRMPTQAQITSISILPSHLYQWPGSTGTYINSVYGYGGVNQAWNVDPNAATYYGEYNDYMTNFILMFNGYRSSGVLTRSRSILDYWMLTGGDRDITVDLRYWSSGESSTSGWALTQSATVRYYNYTDPLSPTQLSGATLKSTTARTVATNSKTLGFNVRCVRAL